MKAIFKGYSDKGYFLGNHYSSTNFNVQSDTPVTTKALVSFVRWHVSAPVEVKLRKTEMFMDQRRYVYDLFYNGIDIGIAFLYSGDKYFYLNYSEGLNEAGLTYGDYALDVRKSA